MSLFYFPCLLEQNVPVSSPILSPLFFLPERQESLWFRPLSSCGLTLSASLCCCSGGSVVQACLFCPFLLSPGPCLNPPNPERALSHCSHPIKSQCPFCLCPFLKQLFLKKLLTLMAIPPHPDPLFKPLDARCIGNTRIRFCVFFFSLKKPIFCCPSAWI